MEKHKGLYQELSVDEGKEVTKRLIWLVGLVHPRKSLASTKLNWSLIAERDNSQETFL